MDRITLRSMTDADWPEVSRIYQAGMDTNLATFETQCPPWEEWNASHLGNCRLVAVQNSKVVGWAALTPVSGRCVYAGVAEVSVYVAPTAQGKGVGTLLLRRLCQLAGQEKYWTLQSGILQNNTASIRLHEKCGFRMVGYRERIGQDRTGAWRNTVLMEQRNCID